MGHEYNVAVAVINLVLPLLSEGLLLNTENGTSYFFVLLQDQLAVLQSACPNLPQERFALD